MEPLFYADSASSFLPKSPLCFEALGDEQAPSLFRATPLPLPEIILFFLPALVILFFLAPTRLGGRSSPSDESLQLNALSPDRG